MRQATKTLGRRSRRGLLVLMTSIGLMAPACASGASTSATITPVLSPNRLGARSALTITIHYLGGEHGVPLPVRRWIMRFPAGLALEIPRLVICRATRLRAHGAAGCPARSLLGHGQALAEVLAGSQTLTEHVALSVFTGPLRGINQPTFDVLGQGYTPINRRFVLTGTVLPAAAPYEEEMVMSIPPIAVFPFEPDASIASLSLTVGTKGSHPSNSGASVLLPESCPPGGFPFAAESVYADGSKSSAFASVLCPVNIGR